MECILRRENRRSHLSSLAEPAQAVGDTNKSLKTDPLQIEDGQTNEPINCLQKPEVRPPKSEILHFRFVQVAFTAKR